VTKGPLSGKAGEQAKEDWKVNGQYVDTPDKGVVGIPYLDAYVEKAAMEFLDDAAKNPDKPFFININFMKVHQPNLPHPDFIGKSPSKSKYADSIVEADARIGNVMNKIRALGLDKGNTLVFWTTEPGRMFIRTPVTPRSAAPRAPIAKAAIECQHWLGCRGKSRPETRTMRSSAASISWRPSRRSVERSCRRTIAKESR